MTDTDLVLMARNAEIIRQLMGTFENNIGVIEDDPRDVDDDYKEPWREDK